MKLRVPAQSARAAQHRLLGSAVPSDVTSTEMSKRRSRGRAQNSSGIVRRHAYCTGLFPLVATRMPAFAIRYPVPTSGCPIFMYVHEQPNDRRRGDLQIRQGFILTLSMFWTTILLVVWSFTPLTSTGVWPLLDLAETSGGRKAPYLEGDVFISVTRTGDIYLEERPATTRDVTRACEFAVLLRRDWRGETYRHEVFVRVDRAAPFSAVRAVVRAAQAANVTRLTFLAKPSENTLFSVYH
jgi:biopolymer transport protein ExbD